MHDCLRATLSLVSQLNVASGPAWLRHRPSRSGTVASLARRCTGRPAFAGRSPRHHTAATVKEAGGSRPRPLGRRAACKRPPGLPRWGGAVAAGWSACSDAHLPCLPLTLLNRRFGSNLNAVPHPITLPSVARICPTSACLLLHRLKDPPRADRRGVIRRGAGRDGSRPVPSWPLGAVTGRAPDYARPAMAGILPARRGGIPAACRASEASLAAAPSKRRRPASESKGRPAAPVSVVSDQVDTRVASGRSLRPCAALGPVSGGPAPDRVVHCL